MPIPNFSILLNDVLNGKQEALEQWYAYNKYNGLNEQEVKKTLQEIEKLSSAKSDQKSHTLYLRAYMHQHGLGGQPNYPEAIRLYEEAIKLGHASARNSLASLQNQLEENKRKNEQKQRLSAALAPYEIEFNNLIKQLTVIKDELHEKAKNDSNYDTVGYFVFVLHDGLLGKMGEFFANPTALEFQQCQEYCAEIINDAVVQSAKHRGWHAVDPILRGFLGVLAAIAVLPALIVEATTKHGYMQTFFGQPPTSTSEKVADFIKKFNAQKEKFENQENEVSAEIRGLKNKAGFVYG